MRVPALVPRYALSICSGDFNEWVGKNILTDYPGSYVFTFEHEMPEFDLGHTFNYAEMAFLIAPRPFMVGSTTVSVIAQASAASTALPPLARACRPAWAANGCDVATIFRA